MVYTLLGVIKTFNQLRIEIGDPEFISVSDLLDHSKGLLIDGTLTLCCEVSETRENQVNI